MSDRIANHGQGGFLDAPTYPTHTHCVETDIERGPNRGSMSLPYALTPDCAYLDAGLRVRVADLLASWQRPAMNAPEIQAWILQVLGYFHDCYRNALVSEPDCWNAEKLDMWSNGKWSPPSILFPRPLSDHAGIRVIRKFYPEFTPTAEHFTNARWGTK